MPLTHTRAFRVRFYECDPYGHLNNTNYLRYAQETAFDASAAAGYDLDRYFSMKQLWLVRGSEIEYLKPLRYGDVVEVKTWVADMRTVSSRRMYEFYVSGSGELAAKAHSDWAYIDTNTGQTTRIPPDLAVAFFPEGLPGSFPPRSSFPAAPPPPPGAFSMRRRVAWQDIDSAGHVNNAVYLNYAEECGFGVIAAHGWPWTRMRDEGFAILLRRHQIQYLLPAFYGDELEVSTWVYDVRRSTASRFYAIRRVSDGALLARLHTLGVWVDLATGRPIRIPAQLLKDFTPNIVQGEVANERI